VLNVIYDSGAATEEYVYKTAIRAAPKAGVVAAVTYVEYKVATSRASDNCRRAEYCPYTYRTR
jgi:hypothetical protein